MKFLGTVGILTLFAGCFLPDQAHSGSDQAILRCSKPHRWVHRARYWIEILDREDQNLLRYGTGDTDQLMEIRLERRVDPKNSQEWVTPESDTLELRFFQRKEGKYRLQFRERGSSSWPFRSDGFRCE